METTPPNPKATQTSDKPKRMLVKSIFDLIGNDNILMFKKVKGAEFMFIIKSKSMKKLPLKEKPIAYPMKDIENLGAFLYKLNREKKA